MSFSATEAAFEGFRLVRRHPPALLFWTLTYIVSFALQFGLVGSSLADVMAQVEALEGVTDPDPTALRALGAGFAMLLAFAAPITVVVGAVLNTAVARAVLRPEDRRFGYLRLGSDELRVLAVSVILAVVTGAVAVVGFTVVGVLAGITQASGIAALWLLVGLALIGAVGLWAWLAVRLSLAVPITVAEQRIAIFDSFAMTHGRFGPLLGMAVIAGMMTMLVSLLSSVVAMPVTSLTGGMEALAAFEGRSTADILRAAGPAVAVWCGLNAVFSALQLSVLNAPFSAAYRDIKGLPKD